VKSPRYRYSLLKTRLTVSASAPDLFWMSLICSAVSQFHPDFSPQGYEKSREEVYQGGKLGYDSSEVHVSFRFPVLFSELRGPVAQSFPDVL